MYNNNKRYSKNFPDPLASRETKMSNDYGMKYAKAIENQWGKIQDEQSLYKKRARNFERNRDYANGVQDTNIYKQILTSLDPNNGDGSLVNLDYTPVPILPKFARIVVNKILSRSPYPNLEAIDPISTSAKNAQKQRIMNQVQLKEQLKQVKEMTGGLVLDQDPDSLPDSVEEAEIFLDTNIKTDAEVAGQIATNLTLEWNDFSDNIYRRCIQDLVSCGMAVVKRDNDPNYGIKTSYVDPVKFIHSSTDDPNFSDLVYAGHIRTISIQELKRIAGDELDEDQYKKIAEKSKSHNSDYNKMNQVYYDDTLGRNVYGYEEYMVDILDFEFISVDCMYFEEKENQYGNTGFYYEGFEYKEKSGKGVYERTPHKMEISSVYGGMLILDCDYLINYGLKSNVPRNMHDVTRARMSYSVVATNLRDSMPKSMVESCIGFADMLQITHLKIQQSIAKAKPDGLIIDIEGLENVQLGKGGELQPLELHDIYEQTGVFYYRSKNAEGGFQGAPIQQIPNSIRNINELITLYNHYLGMIRDTTGINEMMDASTPKGDTLVGVQQQAIAAGNNATYDITNASTILFKQVCQDIVRCLQIIPPDSLLMEIYKNAIGRENMDALSSFSDLPMYNFGVVIKKDMEDQEKVYLEQNIQQSLAQREIDLEDAMAIRSLKDINQAERLLIVRRKKRMKEQQEAAQQNSQMQAQQAQQAQEAASQAEQQRMQLEFQMEQQKMQMKTQMELQLEEVRHQYRKEIELIRAQATLGFKTDDQDFREKLEVFKETKKDDRVKKQAEEQAKLIDKRKGREPFDISII